MSHDDIDRQLREQLPGLRRYALWLTRELSSADDLVQASLEKALARWHTRRPEGELRAWLFAIIYHAFVDGRRKARRHLRFLEFFRGDEPEQPSPDRDYQARSTLQAFERLSEEKRNLLYWVSVEGLSYQEVADMLGVPVGTVMSRLSRARQALRDLADAPRELPPRLRLLK